MEQAVNDAADNQRRDRKHDVVIGLPGAWPRQFGHRSVAAEQRKIKERKGAQEQKRRDPGDPHAAARESEPPIRQQRIEQDAANERVRIVMKAERHP